MKTTKRAASSSRMPVGSMSTGKENQSSSGMPGGDMNAGGGDDSSGSDNESSSGMPGGDMNAAGGGDSGDNESSSGIPGGDMNAAGGGDSGENESSRGMPGGDMNAAGGGDSGDKGDDGGETPPSRTCGTMDVHRRLLSRLPSYAQARDEIENLAQLYEAGVRSATRPGVTRIPVIVHVVWNTVAQNISDAQIDSQIDVLNRDFRRTNPDVSQHTGTIFAANRRCQNRVLPRHC